MQSCSMFRGSSIIIQSLAGPQIETSSRSRVRKRCFSTLGFQDVWESEVENVDAALPVSQGGECTA